MVVISKYGHEATAKSHTSQSRHKPVSALMAWFDSMSTMWVKAGEAKPSWAEPSYGNTTVADN